MRILLSHPTANIFSRKLAQALAEKKVLAQFFTTIVGKNSTARRYLPPVVQEKTSTHGLREWLRLAHQKTSLPCPAWLPHSVDKVYRSLDQFAAQHIFKNTFPAEAIYAYEDGALHSFRAAQEKGLRRIYDLPIAYWKQRENLYAETIARYPAWACTLDGIKDSPEKLANKDEELSLANLVVVPSNFVKESLPPTLRKDQKVIVAPFGTSLLSDNPTTRPTKDQSRPLRILFAGTLTQRKGLADLFTAMKNFSATQCELVVAGSLVAPLSFYRNELPTFTYAGNLAHAELLRLMAQCDLFCLPSIAEGRALVIQEAMGAGLPVIITHQTGCTDLITEGENGFVLPLHSPAQIAQKIEWCLTHRKELATMGESARQSALRLTWENYTQILLQTLFTDH